MEDKEKIETCECGCDCEDRKWGRHPEYRQDHQ